MDTRPSIPLGPVAIGDLASLPRAGMDDVRSGVVKNVTPQSQVSTSVYTAGGTAPVVTIDGAAFSGGAALAPIGTVVDTLNAIPLFTAIAVADNPAGTTLRITWRDTAAHTVSGNAPFAAFATATAAAAPALARPGRAVQWEASPDAMHYGLVREPVAGGEFAGFPLRYALPSDPEALLLGAEAGAMIPGRDFPMASAYVAYRGDNVDAVTVGGAVFYNVNPADPDRGRLMANDGATLGATALTFTAGAGGDDVGVQLGSGPEVYLPGGSTTVAATDATQILPLLAAAYAGVYTFSRVGAVVTATEVTASGSAVSVTDLSGGAASIADAVGTASVAATGQALPGATYLETASAGAGVKVRLPA